MIWLAQQIREPNHADHVIGHIAEDTQGWTLNTVFLS